MRSNTATPYGWSHCAIADVCVFSRGVSWKKSQERRSPARGAVPVLRIPNVQDTLDLTDLLYIDGLTSAQRTKARVRAGWTLLVGSNGNPKRVGNCVYVAEPKDYLFASFLIGATPIDSGRIDSEFLHRLLSSKPVQDEISQAVQGSTGLSNIDLNALKNLRVLVPSLPEQRKIAAILSSVDDTIEKTQAVIDQVQVVKRGLMQELLTRGLPGRHTRFKQTEIGPIPQEWQLKRLSDVASVQTGLAKNKANAGPLSVSYLRVANVQDGFVDLAEVKTVDVHATALSRYALRPGDVLFTEGGDADKLGRGAVWNGEIVPCLHQNHVFVARSLGEIRPMFLSLYRESSRGKSYFLDCSKQTTNLASMNSTQLKNLPLPIPRLDEQDGIVERLGALDVRLSQEENCIKELGRLKAALMSTLLTGELRATQDTKST